MVPNRHSTPPTWRQVAGKPPEHAAAEEEVEDRVWPGHSAGQARADQRAPDTMQGPGGPRQNEGVGSPCLGPNCDCSAFFPFTTHCFWGELEGCVLQEKTEREGGRRERPAPRPWSPQPKTADCSWSLEVLNCLSTFLWSLILSPMSTLFSKKFTSTDSVRMEARICSKEMHQSVSTAPPL